MGGWETRSGGVRVWRGGEVGGRGGAVQGVVSLQEGITWRRSPGGGREGKWVWVVGWVVAMGGEEGI